MSIYLFYIFFPSYSMHARTHTHTHTKEKKGKKALTDQLQTDPIGRSELFDFCLR